MVDLSSSTWIGIKADSIWFWLWVAAKSSSGGWIRVTAASSSSGWIQFKAGYILRLTIICGLIEFQKLDTSYSWFHPSADYELQLILSCGWLESASWNRLAADLYFNKSSKFKDLFCKIHYFYGLFPTAWFQLPLIQALTAVLRTLKKLEEAWGSLRKLQGSSCNWSQLQRLIQAATAGLRTATNELPPELSPPCPLIKWKGSGICSARSS